MLLASGGCFSSGLGLIHAVGEDVLRARVKPEGRATILSPLHDWLQGQGSPPHSLGILQVLGELAGVVLTLGPPLHRFGVAPEQGPQQLGLGRLLFLTLLSQKVTVTLG